MLKKMVNGTKRYKKCPLYLSRAPTHYSFTFDLRFLYELKNKVCLSKTACGFFPFSIPFHFYQSLYFCSTKSMEFLTLKRHNYF